MAKAQFLTVWSIIGPYHTHNHTQKSGKYEIPIMGLLFFEATLSQLTFLHRPRGQVKKPGFLKKPGDTNWPTRLKLASNLLAQDFLSIVNG